MLTRFAGTKLGGRAVRDDVDVVPDEDVNLTADADLRPTGPELVAFVVVRAL